MTRLHVDTIALDQATTDLRQHAADLMAGGFVDSHSDLSTFSMVSGFRGVGVRLGALVDPVMCVVGGAKRIGFAYGRFVLRCV